MRNDLVGFLLFTALLIAGCSGSEGEAGASDLGGPLDTSPEVGSADPGEAEAGCRAGAPCDDGDPCTRDDRCLVAGACAGTAYACKAPASCVSSVCDGAGGCTEAVAADSCFVKKSCFAAGQASGPGDTCFVCDPSRDRLAFTVAESAPCNDGLSCTRLDRCQADGSCAGQPLSCDDGEVCTFDACSEENAGCAHTPVNIPCDDGDACTSEDSCVQGSCESGEPTLCPDDGDPCTTPACDSKTGCGTEPRDCDDGNSCTTDACTPGVGCAHTTLGDDTPCDDGNPCTGGDLCKGGVCGSQDPPSCDDGNPCTDDGCDPAKGCLHAFNQLGCDDGFACTIDDVCAAGICAGQKETCTKCAPTFSAHANKLTTFTIPTTGNPGAGLDLDGDPTTCAPPGNCGGGVDNALGVLGGFVNGSFANALDQGILVYLVEMDGLSFSGADFTIRVYLGYADVNVTCDVQTQVCGYWVSDQNFDPDCVASVRFDNARIDPNGVLTAGGPGALFVVKGTLASGADITFPIFNATIEGTVTQGTLADGTPTVTSINGIVGGGVPKQILRDTLNEVSNKVFPPSVKQAINDFIDNDIQDDLDTDGDGVPDAASVNIRFTTIPARLLGIP